MSCGFFLVTRRHNYFCQLRTVEFFFANDWLHHCCHCAGGKHTFDVKVCVDEDLCDGLVPLSTDPRRCRWPFDRWSRPPLLWTPRGPCWLPSGCLPAPSRWRRSVDGFPPPPPPPSDPPPRRWGEKEPLVGDAEPGLLRVRFCSEYQWGRLSSTEASEKASSDFWHSDTNVELIIGQTLVP